jgi:hypothetical protein
LAWQLLGVLLHSCHPACQHHLQLSSYSAKLF